MNNFSVPSINEESSGGLSRRVHPRNSEGPSWECPESGGVQEELQQLPEDRTEKKQKSQGGILNRLRKRLSSRSSPESELPVSAAHAESVEVTRDNLIIRRDKRLPQYVCVPFPPGHIPTDVMLTVERAEERNELGLCTRSARTGGATLAKSRHEAAQQEATVIPNYQRGEHCKPTKVLRNNWV